MTEPNPLLYRKTMMKASIPLDKSESDRESRKRLRAQWLYKLTNTKDLPVLPQIVANIDQWVRDETISVQQVAKGIQAEPVLTGRLMRLANSVLFGGGRKTVTSVAMAVGRMGLRQVKQVVYTITLPQLFAAESFFDHFKYWKHSLATATLARTLCRLDGGNADEQEIAYLSGLMHDIGIILFISLDSKEYLSLIKKLETSEKSLFECEQEVFDLDHAEFGSKFIMDKWNVDPRVSKVVAEHHSPLSFGRTPLKATRAVTVANKIVNLRGYTNGIEKETEPLEPEKLAEIMGIQPRMADNVLLKLDDEVMNMECMLGY